MNDTINMLAEFLRSQDIEVLLPEENENVIWFSLKLPSYEAAVTFYVNFSEETEAVLIMASRMVKFSVVGPDLLLRINEFNADPSVFGCKMFIDQTGEITVGYSAFVRTEPKAPQVIDLIDIVLKAADRYYGSIAAFANDN